jgi:DNA-binding response OmpR family regulator
MRVLIVDDDATFCQLLTKILQREGFETEGATDSLVGYDLALHNHYDLHIFDVRMPGLSGTELVAGVKKASPHAKILLVSSFADAALQQTARDLDVALLSKPFTSAQFLTEITDMLNAPSQQRSTTMAKKRNHVPPRSRVRHTA